MTPPVNRSAGRPEVPATADAVRPPLGAGRRAGRCARRRPQLTVARPAPGGGDLGADPRRGAVADPAALASSRRAHPAPAVRTACAPTWSSRSPGASSAMRSRRPAVPGRDDDPWRPERAVWPLLELLDEHLGEPWLATVADHLGVTAESGTDDDTRRSRRFSTARHIVDLYDRYAVHRPAMIRSWHAGHDVTAAATPLPPDSAWQAELWRHLRGRIGEASPGERLEGACAELAADENLTDFPERLALFGLTRLPASYLDVLRALASQRDVHLFLLHPSPVLWQRVSDADRADAGDRRLRRSDDPTVELPVNPLLRSWGRDSREMQLVLTAGEHPVVDDHRPLPSTDPTTLLHRVQHAVRHDDGSDRRAASRRHGPPAGSRPQRSQSPGPRLPRPRPAGRGGPRRDPPPPGRGPVARGSRRHRHVSRHRGVRPADPRHLRRRWRPRRRGRGRRGTAGRRRSSTRPAGPAGRPFAAPDQPGPRCRHRAPDAG